MSDSEVSDKVFKYSQDSRKKTEIVTEEKLYTPGIYSATGTVTLDDGDGFVTITMQFEEDSFIGINIGAVSDNLCDAEFEEGVCPNSASHMRKFNEMMVPYILEAQSSNFIGVSNMPITMKATRLAVEDCIKQAKGEKVKMTLKMKSRRISICIISRWSGKRVVKRRTSLF